MSDRLLALVITLSLVAAALVCVPFLHLCRRSGRWIFRRTLPMRGMGLLFLLAVHGAAFGQFTVLNGITTVAGTGTRGSSGDAGQATAATIYNPHGVVVDGSGNLYFSGLDNRIRKVAPNGIITTVAGNGNYGFSGDNGPATSAMLYNPQGLALDAGGNLYVADSDNYRVRKITPGGTISTFAGTGVSGETGDNGPATSAAIHPVELGFDAIGNLYVACDFVVRKISPTGTITTFAGSDTASGFSGDGGLATSATFGSTDGVAADAAGNVYISSLLDFRVREVTAADGKIKTIAGNGTGSSGGDGGLAAAATLEPNGMVVDGAGNLFIVDLGGGNAGTYIREIFASSKKIASVAGGGGGSGSGGDGSLAVGAQFGTPYDLALDGNGNIFVADYANNRIRAIGPIFIPPTVVTSSAARQYYYLETTANETITSFTAPTSLGNKQEYTVGAVTGCTIDGKTSNAAGSICAVPITFTPAYPGQRPVSLQAVTSTGNVNFPMNGLGTAPVAALTPGILTTAVTDFITPTYSGFSGGVIDSAGNFYTASSGTNLVYKTTPAGVTTTYAGNGQGGDSGDGGPATSAGLNFPQAVAIDAAGNLYIAEYYKIREVVGGTGMITTFAGTGSDGYSGDGSLATNAKLGIVGGLTVDGAGNLYASDFEHNVVRKINAITGIITTVAGNGAQNFTGDNGPAVAATLNTPVGIAVDGSNNLYIADMGNARVRRINPDTGIITTVAGNGTTAAPTEGVAATAGSANASGGLAVDSAGDLYVGDGSLVRRITASTQIINTVAGTYKSGYAPYTGEGGPATAATIDPLTFTVAPNGNLYIFDGDGGGVSIRKVDVSTSALNFPTRTNVGSLDSSDDPKTALLNNIGNQPLSGFSGNGGITSSWLIDAASTCFPFTPVVAGASCTIPVDFKPTQSGASLTGTLSLLDTSLNAQPSTQTINLVGAATGAGSLSISPITQTFPSTTQGSISATQTSTITNTTSQAVYLNSGSLTDSTDFTQSDNCNGLVAANTGTCTVSFTFTPQSTGPLSSTYSIHDLNNPNSPLTVVLSGNATSAGVGAIALSPSAVTFTTTAGVMAASQNVTLTNTGTATAYLNTSPISITGTNANVFQGSGGTCGYTLSAGKSCNAAVSFLSTATGTYTATYTVTYGPTSTTTATASVPLTGTVSGTAQASLTPPSFNYGNVTTGSTATAQTFTLTNAGTISLTITSVSLTGTTPASFSILTNGCGSSLAGGNSCNISVSFTPSAATTQTASLTVVDAVGTQTSNLSGTGVAPATPADFTLTATPAVQSSYLGASVSYQLTLAPVSAANPYASAINLSASGLPAGATASFAPASVTPGAAAVGSVMTLTIPALQGSKRDAPLSGHGRSPVIFSATLLLALILSGNRRLRSRLSARVMLLLLLLVGLSATLTGCSSSTGFAVPQSTSTITITGTSGTLVHTTTVTLTLK